MALANPLWGAPRVHGELLKLGFEVSERTISRLMPRRRTPPSQTWQTFLENHLGSTVAIDFFAVPTLTCRILFVFVVLAHDRRRIVHVNVTQHPTSAWTRQQLREAFPLDANARFLLYDRDTTFDAAFGQAVEAPPLRTASRLIALGCSGPATVVGRGGLPADSFHGISRTDSTAYVWRWPTRVVERRFLGDRLRWRIACCEVMATDSTDRAHQRR